MSGWLWLAFFIPLIFAVPPTRHGRGRFLTRWAHGRLAPRMRPPMFRQAQLLVLFLVTGFLPAGDFWSLNQVCFFVPVIALFVDDWLTGDDDDRWRRWWEGVRNHVKWLMDLPQPVAGPRTA